MRSQRLEEWAAARWPDLALGVHWLIDHAAPEYAQGLLALAAELRRQGTCLPTYLTYLLKVARRRATGQAGPPHSPAHLPAYLPT